MNMRDPLIEAAHTPAQRDRKPAARTRIFGLLLLFAIVAALLAGILPRLQHRAALTAETSGIDSERLPVHVIEAKAAAPRSDVTLPGNMQAIEEAPIYARVSGYITHRYADIGDKVKAGQVLADIDAPELDQELMQARATAAHSIAMLGQARASLVQAQAKMTLAKATLDRWVTLATRGVVSHQEKDQKQSDFDSAAAEVEALKSSVSAAEADVAAQNANVHRLQDLTGFKHVSAPFAGVITTRNIDVGNLIEDGSDSSTRELFHIAKFDTLRIMVNVPQPDAPLIHDGGLAFVQVTEFRGREFPGQIARTADSLDPNSRTLLTEVHIPNQEGILLPGMFTSVRFPLQQTAPAVVIPADVLIVDARGTQAATVDRSNVVHLLHLTLGRDFGATIEVVNGLQPGQRLIVNPPDTLTDGAKVDVLSK
ncbi:MAG TPA: efflux RND transporter periplasmic adaptor subunit [Bryobacteraceae bacterium]|jgi:RND family efflux transporter MFP subunit|nr:efflux RND transporter periplasmic adaptor subunit [Bryobacteraceae bacterium]